MQHLLGALAQLELPLIFIVGGSQSTLGTKLKQIAYLCHAKLSQTCKIKSMVLQDL